MKKICLTLMTLLLVFASCKEKTNMEEKTDAPDSLVVIENATLAMEEVEEMPMDSATVQKAWEEYMTPGKVHEMLAAEVGSWTNEMTFWMGPEAEPQKATSTAEVKMILGGRYQRTDYKGEMWGMPFEGIATVAYDKASNEIVSTWIDNMGTGMLVLRGKYDGSDNIITTTGSFTDPITGKEKQVREVYTIVSADTRRMEMYETPANGEEYKSMEIVMTRKAS